MPAFDIYAQIYVAMLPCFFRSDDDTYYVGIVVAAPRERSNYYTRLCVTDGNAIVSVPNTRFLSTKLKTITFAPLQRPEHRTDPSEYYRHKCFVSMFTDAREYDLRSVLPQDCYLLDDENTNPERIGHEYRMTNGLPQRSEYLFHNLRDNTEVVVSVSKKKDPDRSGW